MTFAVVDEANENVRTFDARSIAEDKAAGVKQMVSDPSSIRVVQGDYDNFADYQNNHDNGDDPEVSQAAEVVDAPPEQPEPSDNDTAAMLANPIDYLEGINSEFVNHIKGTPAISKRGFRYIQTDLGVSTTAEIVETFDDPLGVVVHARAELPDGRYAEAHGEGYRTEGGVEDNEFVRYADTRAKNRALSDLTSSGALSESEL
jgi:hypothetical protein